MRKVEICNLQSACVYVCVNNVATICVLILFYFSLESKRRKMEDSSSKVKMKCNMICMLYLKPVVLVHVP